jgi:flagellar basal-body rod modification protein FlgD
MNNFSSQVASVDYLQLLTVQLKNQDPIDPVDQQSLLTDMTQFSILEGIEKLNRSFEQILKLEELGQGAGLVGSTVQYREPSTGAIRSGSVTEMFVGDQAINLIIGGQAVPIHQVLGVAAS